MPNRKLTKPEIEWASEFLKEILDKLKDRSAGDPDLLFALRRKTQKELTNAERGSPMHRRKIKAATRALQAGLCAECAAPLPNSYSVLDRIAAVKGYVAGNVRVLCEPCDRKIQVSRGYHDGPSN